MTDDAESDGHARVLGSGRTAVNRVAGLTEFTKGQIIERLKDTHGHDRFFVAGETDMRFDGDQHLGTALMA